MSAFEINRGAGLRFLKHLAIFFFGACIALIFGYWGAVLSLSTFAPGGDVVFTEAQERRGAIGDAMLTAFDWPSRHLLGYYRNWVFSSICYGAVLYGIFIGLRRLFRKWSS